MADFPSSVTKVFSNWTNQHKNRELGNYSFSFRLLLSRLFILQVYYTTQRRSRHSTDTVPEFHAEAPQATVSEVLAQGPYMAARAGVEPMTLGTKGVDSTKAPPRLSHSRVDF